jgi:hypothetical protein
MPTIICKTEQDEREALIVLRRVKAQADTGVAVDSRWITFNGLSFDCPVLETRALLLGLPSFHMDIRKYGSKNIVDLYAELTFFGSDGAAILSRSQQSLAHRFGYVSTDTLDGSMVPSLVAEGRYDEVAAHCQADVEALAFLYRAKFGAKARGIVFDLETAPIDGVASYRPWIKPDGRLTDQKKIEASIDDKLERAGLDPYLCRIVCLGYLVLA